MKYLILLFTAISIFSSCEIKEQADELRAMEKCTYEVVSADSVRIAGRDIGRFVKNGKLNLIEAPSLALAFFQQKVPLSGILNLKITNPGSKDAGVNNLEYKIFIKGVEIITGSIDQKIVVPANGESSVVPIKIDKDIYPLLASQSNQQAVQDFFGSQTEKYADVIFKVRPSFMVGSKKVDYPNFISINTKLSNKQIVSYLQNLK